MALITLKSFDNSKDAHFMRIRLENEGIPVYIFDENSVILNPLNSYAIGGIKIKIDIKDLEFALKIEKEFEETKIEKENKILICEKCRSTHFYSNFKKYNSFRGILSAIISFLFAVYPISFKEVYKCKNCGKEYEI